MQKRNRPLIDAHVHVWTSNTARYPLATPYTVKDMVPSVFTPEDLFSHCHLERVGRVTLIQMYFYRYNNSYMLDSIARFPDVFRGVAVIDETASNAPALMRTMAEKGVRGFRLFALEKPAEKFFASDGMHRMWQAGAKQNLSMCVLINPEDLPIVDGLCTRYPDTPVVVDHFARIGMKGPIRNEDLDALCRLARFKRVHVKVSAFYALGKKRPPYLDLASMIRRVRDAFGAERLMWASDCPFQVDLIRHDHNYHDSISLIRDRLDFLTPDDREWMLRKTAEKVFFS